MNTENKKGFTLIELLGIIVLLAILGLLVFKVIDGSLKNSKDKAYEKQLALIKLAAENYMSEHPEDLPENLNATTVSLGLLKSSGFSEMEVKNPKTNKCFSNNLQVRISYMNGNFSYKVLEDTIEEVDDCGLTEIGEVTPDNDYLPVVSISGAKEAVSSEETITYTVSYNVSVDEERVKEYIKYYVVSSKEEVISKGNVESVGQEEEISTGYSREVTVRYKKVSDSDDHLYLYIDEGFLQVGNKISAEVKSSNTSIYNSPPIIDVVNPDPDTPEISETPCVSTNASFVVSWAESLDDYEFLPDDTQVAKIGDNYACVSSSESQSTGFSFGVDVISNQTVSYELIGDDNEGPKKQDVAANTSVSVAFKKPIKIKACNYNDSCSILEVDSNKNDCSSPKLKDTVDTENNNPNIISINDMDDDKRIDEIFTDQESGIGNVYAFVYPYDYATFTKNLNSIYKYARENGYASSFAASGNFLRYFAPKGYINLLSGYNIGTYETATTISQIKSDMKKVASFCEENYLYFLVADHSILPNISFYASDYIINNGSCDRSNTANGSWSTGTACDTICKMKKNSLKWWDPNLSNSEKQELNDSNFKLCYEGYGDKCYHDTNEGIWYYCENGSTFCKELYTGIESAVVTSSSFNLVPATNTCLKAGNC